MTISSPYPGLRPFHRDEAHIFFGREEQTDELQRRLNETRFLAVVGPSGCGKSSLVRAGMIAALETGFMVPAGPRWRFVVMRPGSHPMRRLAATLIEEVLIAEGIDKADALGFLSATLRRGPLGVVEALRETPLPPDTNLLILVDQFEEIFRFRREGGSDEADAFVALLLASVRQREMPVYVVITMRSDFLGDCAVFTGLPEALNESQFLTPRLIREQRRAAILGPARVFGGDVEPELVSRLLNEMGTDPDQLPVLQHLLMRMWTWQRAGAISHALSPLSDDALVEPTEADEVTGRVLTLADYEQVGGLKNALSNHADEAFGALDERQQKIAEVLFRRLSERGVGRRDIRRPTPAGEIAALADASVEEVVRVVNVFRAPGCSFLIPAYPEPIRPESVLDISHESLIRKWDRLRNWAEQEAQSAETYRFLEQTACRWKQGRAALWGTPDLEIGLDWQAKEHPTSVWAERYGGDFALAMAFLGESERKRQMEEAEEEARRKRQVGRLRRIAAVLAGLCLASVGGIIFILYGWFFEHEAYYNTQIERWGVAEGYGPLGKDQVRRRKASLKFVSIGWFGDVLSVEAVDSQGNCTHRHSEGAHLQEHTSSLMASPLRECRWEFLRDQDGHIAYKKAYNKFGELVWGFLYVPTVENRRPERQRSIWQRIWQTSVEKPRERQAYFVGPDGFPQPRKNARADVVRFSYSEEGNEVRVTYWTRDNKQPATGPDHEYGKEREFYQNGLVKRSTSLDAAGRPMNDTDGNATLALVSDELGNARELEAFDKNGAPVNLKLGFHRIELKHDQNGNLVQSKLFDKNKSPVMGQAGFHSKTNAYDDRGYLVEERMFDTHGQAATIEDGYHQDKLEWDDRGNLVQVSFFGKQGQPVIIKDRFHRSTMRYDDRGNRIDQAFYDAQDRPTKHKDGFHRITAVYDDRGNAIEKRHFDTQGHPVMTKDGFYRWTARYDDRRNQIELAFYDAQDRPTNHKDGYHVSRMAYDERGNQTETTYFDTEGQPTRHKDGFHELRKAYDERGNRTEAAYFDADGKPTLYEGKHHKEVTAYDDRGNPIESAYFDIEGRPTRHEDGYHRWTASYDERGNRIELALFDTEGRPTLGKKGFHRFTGRYDERGNRTEAAYFDADGKPTLYEGKHHKEVTAYDDRGNPIESAYFDIEGRPTRHEDGYHRWTASYDERGNRIELALFDTEGRPTRLKDGYHVLRKAYDDRGNEIEQAYFDLDGKPFSRDGGYALYLKKRSSYDERDRLVKIVYVDKDDQPLITADVLYDAAGQEVWRRYTGKEEENLQQHLRVLSVLPKSQAQTLGVRPGDIALSYDGKNLEKESDLDTAMAATGGGTRELLVRRGNELKTFAARPGSLGIEVTEIFERASAAGQRLSGDTTN